MPPTHSPKRRVAILGATGAVGQAFVRLLAQHPWFEITALAASERSAGKPYAEATRWIGDDAIPSAIADMPVLACDPSVIDADIVFSALDAAAAGDVEPAFARAGRVVLSNAKNYRMDPDVPLVLPEVNPHHLDVLPAQRERRGWSGAIVTNGNCAAIPAAMVLAPLHERFGVRRVFMATMQAVSGAGYPGVPSLDILGNVIPYIKDEEPKIEIEINKMLGHVSHGAIRPAPFAVTAHANRVPVEHGHTVCLSVEFEHERRRRGRVLAAARLAGRRGSARPAERAAAPPGACAMNPTARSRAATAWKAMAWRSWSGGCGRTRCST